MRRHDPGATAAVLRKRLGRKNVRALTIHANPIDGRRYLEMSKRRRIIWDEKNADCAQRNSMLHLIETITSMVRSSCLRLAPLSPLPNASLGRAAGSPHANGPTALRDKRTHTDVPVRLEGSRQWRHCVRQYCNQFYSLIMQGMYDRIA